MKYNTQDDGKISILLPRFNNKLIKSIQADNFQGKHININLDTFGSKTWELMDGHRNAEAIARELVVTFPEKFRDETEARERVAAFLSRLYQERYITFQQLLGQM